jgi:hypothetical protein
MSIVRPIDLCKLPDCNGLSENGRCTRLTVYYCLGEVCTFKQTHNEQIDSLQCAYQRLASLDSSIQNHIAKRYYGGNMPWNEESPT